MPILDMTSPILAHAGSAVLLAFVIRLLSSMRSMRWHHRRRLAGALLRPCQNNSCPRLPTTKTKYARAGSCPRDNHHVCTRGPGTQDLGPTKQRRTFLSDLSMLTASIIYGGGGAAIATGDIACADEVPSEFSDENGLSMPVALRQVRGELIDAIERGSSEEVILDAMSRLIPFDPTRGTGATSPSLGGEWELLWASSKAEPVKVARSLPPFLRARSLQFVGEPATQLVGEGRVAQVQEFGFGRLVLSSGATPDLQVPSTLVISPPFRLDARLPRGARSSAKVQIVEARDDRGFRSLNNRSEEEQAAPRNRFEQAYLEDSGLPGDLRISRVVEGDPQVVGSVFVHRRL